MLSPRAGPRRRRALIGLLALVAVVAQGADDGKLRIRLRQPDGTDLLAGSVTLRADVEGAPAAGIDRVEFLVDGAPLGVDREPPYKISWTTVDPRRDHLVRVTVVAVDGTRAYDLLSIPILGFISRTTVAARAPEFVLVDVTFLDEDGRPLVDVRREEVRVLDTGRNREVELFEPDGRPLAAMLLLDASSSTEPFWEQLARSTRLFAETLREGDRATVEAFHDLSYVVAPMGSPPAELEQAIAGFTEWGGGTRLHDALTRAALFTLGGEATRRRALVLLTDADDQGSMLTLEDAAEYLLRGAVETHAVLFGVPKRFEPRGPYSRIGEIRRAQRKLTRIVGDTGGATYDGEELPLEEIFLRIGERLRAQYLLGFTSDPRRAGRERSIEVRLKRAGIQQAHVVRSHFAGRSLEEHLALRIAAGSVTERLVAIRAAAMSREPVAIRALIEALGEGGSMEHGVAREARLALLGQRVAAVPYLLERVVSGGGPAVPSARVLIEVMVLLVRTDGPGDVEEALALLGQGDPVAGIGALERLAALPLADGTRSLLDALLRHLREE